LSKSRGVSQGGQSSPEAESIFGHWMSNGSGTDLLNNNCICISTLGATVMIWEKFMSKSSGSGDPRCPFLEAPMVLRICLCQLYPVILGKSEKCHPLLGVDSVHLQILLMNSDSNTQTRIRPPPQPWPRIRCEHGSRAFGPEFASQYDLPNILRQCQR